ncbi:MAG: hypothetical protein H6573_00190 [Lewinellaceae bacterium]|nr:hypothetical protein [Lewinellaceae bacterium]
MVLNLDATKKTFPATKKNPFLAAHSIEANIIIGMASKNCAGHGICKILAHHEGDEKRCGQVPAIIEIDCHRRLRMLFPKEKICKRLLKSQFLGDNFLVSESFYLPGWLCSQLEFSAFYIPAGSYVLTSQADCYIVGFYQKIS